MVYRRVLLLLLSGIQVFMSGENKDNLTPGRHFSLPPFTKYCEYYENRYFCQYYSQSLKVAPQRERASWLI